MGSAVVGRTYKLSIGQRTPFNGVRTQIKLTFYIQQNNTNEYLPLFPYLEQMSKSNGLLAAIMQVLL